MMEAAAHGADVAGRFVSRELMWLESPLLCGFALSRASAASRRTCSGWRTSGSITTRRCPRSPGVAARRGTTTSTTTRSRARTPSRAGSRLQDTPREMGPLAFARGMQAYRRVDHIPHSAVDDSYDRGMSQAFREQEVVVEEGPFARGDVSFHHTLNFHTAGANRTTAPAWCSQTPTSRMARGWSTRRRCSRATGRSSCRREEPATRSRPSSTRSCRGSRRAHTPIPARMIV